jgi:hypothetical protein
MCDGPEAGLTHIDALLEHGELANYYLAHSARADMYRRLGRTAEARASYEKALALTQQEPERQFLGAGPRRTLTRHRMPHPWQFHGWAAANSPCMFIGHSEIVAFLLYRFGADKPAPLLRRWILALYYHKLLSAPSPSRDTPLSRVLPRSYGADPPAPSICSCRLRGHARACPSSL